MWHDVIWIVFWLFVLACWFWSVCACRVSRAAEDQSEAVLRQAVACGALTLNESRAMRNPALAYGGRTYPVATGELPGETPWERGEL